MWCQPASWTSSGRTPRISRIAIASAAHVRRSSTAVFLADPVSCWFITPLRRAGPRFGCVDFRRFAYSLRAKGTGA